MKKRCGIGVMYKLASSQKIEKFLRSYLILYIMPKKILIVDDEEDITERMSKIVSREGYHPLTASDGTYALEILKTESVDLVLADNSMHDLDGIKLMGIILGNLLFLNQVM